MFMPVRCFSCNKELSSKHELYLDKISSGTTAKNAMYELGIKRYCCKRMFLGHVDIGDHLLQYDMPCHQ